MKLPISLNEQAAEYGTVLTTAQFDKLERYAELLVQWNEKINLTSIIEPEEIAVKHFLDSLLLLDAVKLPQNATMIDVGTGAGFPSLPCKIVRDDIKLTLLDSLNKRINFLTTVCNDIGVSAVALHSRAEEAGKKPELREKFDIATARAVANLRELAEYCLPFVKVGGFFVALKGYEIDDELEKAKPAIKLLGGKVERVEKYLLPNDNRRAIVIIKKISQMLPKYPRMSAKILKSPL